MAYDVVDTEDCPNINTSIDVTATVQGVENDAVLPPEAVLNDNSFLILF